MNSSKEIVEENELRMFKIVILLIAVFLYSSAFIGPIQYFLNEGKGMHDKADAEVINGILTISGIILAFSATRMEIKHLSKRLLYRSLLFFVQVMIFASVGLGYYIDYLRLGFGSLYTLMAATVSLQFNLWSIIVFPLVDFYWRLKYESNDKA